MSQLCRKGKRLDDNDLKMLVKCLLPTRVRTILAQLT